MQDKLLLVKGLIIGSALIGYKIAIYGSTCKFLKRNKKDKKER